MLANIAVLGPGDEPAIHDIENAKKAVHKFINLNLI